MSDPTTAPWGQPGPIAGSLQPEVARAPAAADPRDTARLLDCFTEHEVAELAGVKLSTLEAWRRRGTGPAYILFGTRYLYTREALATFLRARIRAVAKPAMESVL